MAFKAAGAVNGTRSGFTVTPALPAGWAAGDFAIAFGYIDIPAGSPSPSSAVPSGWTEIASVASASCYMRAFYRFLQAGDSDPTLTLATSGTMTTQQAVSVVVTYKGIDTTTPLDGVTPATNSGTGTPNTTAGVTTQTPNAIAVTLCARGDDEAYSSESYGGSTTGVTERVDGGVTNADDAEICVFDKLISSPGATGTASATTSATDPYAAITLALRTIPDYSPPTGTWTAPAADYDVVSGASVALTVTATDALSGVEGVQFKNITLGTLIGSEDTSSPYSVSWDSTSVEDGIYQLGATMRDGASPANNEATVYRWVEVANRTDVASPSGSVRFPSDSGGAPTVSGTVEVRVGVYDDRFVRSVELLVDGATTGMIVYANLDNRVRNGYFEASADGWSLISGATIARSASEHKYENASLQIVCAADDDGARNTGAYSWTAGYWYEVTAWVKGVSTEVVKMGVYDGSSVVAETNLVLDGTWQQIAMEVECVTSAVHMVQFRSGSGAQTFYVDGVAAIRHATFAWQTALHLNDTHTLSARIVDGADNEITTAEVDVITDNSAALAPNVRVYVAFDSLVTDEEQTWEEVTEYVRQISTRHGHDNEMSRFDAGEAGVLLDNRTRRFDYSNASSPYYLKAVPGKRIRITAEYVGSTFVLHEGTTRSWNTRWVNDRAAYIAIESVDDFGALNEAKINTPSASLTTALAGSNNDLTFTYKYGGGNDISVEYVVESDDDVADTSTGVTKKLYYEPDRKASDLLGYGSRGVGSWYGGWSPMRAKGPPPVISIGSRKLTVRLAQTGSVVTTTAAQVKAAIEADKEANAMLSVTHPAGNDGSGVVTTMGEQFLTGGERAIERSGDRIAWSLDQLGHPVARRQIAPGLHNVQAVQLDRQPGLNHAKDCAISEGGFFFMDAAGNAVFQDAQYRATSLVKATFSTKPNYEAGEHYMRTPVQRFDLDRVRNDISVSAPDLDTATASDTTSQLTYYQRSLDQATLLTSFAELQDRADLLLADYKDAFPYIQSIVLEPTVEYRETLAHGTPSPSAWPTALNMEVSDKILVNVIPTGGGEVSFESFVEWVGHQIDMTGPASKWTIEVGLSVVTYSSQAPSPPDEGGGGGGGEPGGGGEAGNWLLDDPVQSILGSTTRLA